MRRCVLSLWILMWILGSAPQLQAQTREECQECHADPELTTETESGEEISLFVPDSVFDASVHADLECIDCHADIVELPHEDTLKAVDCGSCHEDEAEAVAKSVHGMELRARSPDAPACADCHGTHDILPMDNPASRISKANQPKTCGRCHSDPDIIARNQIPMVAPVAIYEGSIHGRLTQEREDAATCSDCHRGHLILTPLNPASSIFKLEIPNTCGKCHEAIYEEYRISVHARALQQGAKDAPVCTDCHGEHDILRPENPESPTSGFRVPVEVCSPCHASERLAKKYGLTPARVTTYENSYHGLALRGGKATVANCGSCHGVHAILPSSDPRSPIHRDNLVETCGKCHPNPTENFARGRIHPVGEEAEARVIQMVRWIYVVLIAVVIGFMVLHNFIDFIAKAKRLRLAQHGHG